MATLTDRNGLNISISEVYKPQIYLSNGWGSIWNMVNGALPTPIMSDPEPYDRAQPIDYSEINSMDAIKNGIPKQAVEFIGNSLYTNFSLSMWEFHTNSTPIPVINGPSLYPKTEIDYTPWSIMELSREGTMISNSNSKKTSTYASLGWSIPSIWNLKDGVSLPEVVLPPADFYDRTEPIDYTEIEMLEHLKDGSRISDVYTLLKDTYVKASWDFEKSWGIRENYSLPRPLRWSRHTPISDPMSTTAWEVLLKPDEDGTLSYKDDTWVAELNPRRVYTDGGYVGDSVQHTMHNEVVKTLDGTYYVFMGSSVEDDTYPSGYTIPEDGIKHQLVTINDGFSSDVAFYYIKVVAPEYEQLIKVATENPDVEYHLIATSKRPSSIKLRLPNRKYAYLPLVPLDDPFSSLVKVKTLNGIMAVQSSKINGSLFSIIEDDKSKLSVLYVTKDVYSNDSIELIAELKRLGHRVIIMGDSTIVNKEYDGFDQYDLIVIGRTTTSSYSNIISLSRKPIILGYAVENAKNLQTELDFSSNPYHSPDQFNPTQTVINNTHPIMLPFAKNQTFNAYKDVGNQFIGVLDGQNGTISGVPLIKVSNHELNPAYSMTAYENISGYRRVYMGFLYKDFSDTTKILLERSIRWVMKQDGYLYK